LDGKEIVTILYSSLEGQRQKEREPVGHLQGFTRVETGETALPTRQPIETTY